MAATADRRGTARGVLRRSIRWTLLANGAGVAVVSIYTNVIASSWAATSTRVTILVLVLAVAYVSASFFVGLWWVRRTFERVCRYLAEERLPTVAERDATLGLPSSVARVVLTAWIVGALAVGVPVGTAPGSSGHAFQAVIAVLLGGFTTALLTFLLLDRSFRPLYAEVLTGEGTTSVRLGVARRLLLSWALGSGVPLLILVLAPIGGRVSRGHLQALNWYLGAVGLAAGALLLLITARSVADPIEGLRHALRRVQDGTLDVVVTVDDGGEVGALQQGFNRMVGGLRERERLQDLFGRHVGVEVARAALERRVELSGELQHVSVLFVDLIGSTALTQRLSAVEVVAVLNRFFTAAVSATHAEGGWVNKFEGDAALCVFGAPNQVEDHAARALRAARSLRASLDVLARSQPDLDAGIGVSSGVVVAGNVGTADRYEYTVIGDPVNEAARLTEMAKQYSERVVASGSTVGAAPSEKSNWVPSDCVTLRGRSAPTQTFVPA